MGDTYPGIYLSGHSTPGYIPLGTFNTRVIHRMGDTYPGYTPDGRHLPGYVHQCIPPGYVPPVYTTRVCTTVYTTRVCTTVYTTRVCTRLYTPGYTSILQYLVVYRALHSVYWVSRVEARGSIL